LNCSSQATWPFHYTQEAIQAYSFWRRANFQQSATLAGLAWTGMAQSVSY